MPTDQRRRVFIVDDEPAILKAFARLLGEAGYVVQTSERASVALQQVAEFRPDVVILDLRMPQMDGLAFLRALRAEPTLATVPVAVVTGDILAPPEIIEALLALGADVRFKPVILDELVAVVENLSNQGAALGPDHPVH